MNLLVVGGKLQGTEVLYLSQKAGINTTLLDMDEHAIARGLCDTFVCEDIKSGSNLVKETFLKADAVIPANENDEVLLSVCNLAKEYNIPLLFDADAYNITKSKQKSNEIFSKNSIDTPGDLINESGPYIVKPSGESGSVNVSVLENMDEVDKFLSDKIKSDWIVEKYIDALGYSVEVIGVPGKYRTYPITQIHVDSGFDCYKVTCPVNLPQKAIKDLQKTAIKIAEILNLKGIMDVEALFHNDKFYVLEIDARMPSQTPITVYHSSGMNYVSELCDVLLNGDFTKENMPEKYYTCYEHYIKEGENTFQKGEHVMTRAGKLKIDESRLYSESVISDMQAERTGDFKGIFINWDETSQGLEIKRNKTKEALLNLK